MPHLVQSGAAVQHGPGIAERIRYRASGASAQGVASGIVGIAILDGPGAVHHGHCQTKSVVDVLVGADRATGTHVARLAERNVLAHHIPGLGLHQFF